MKPGKILALFSALAMLAGLMGVAPVAAVARMVPFLKVGPRAVKSTSLAPAAQPYFTCQLGQVKGQLCYDPTQMRRAYNVDTLINAGYDGTGETIVIVDAFQSPYLAADLDQFDSDYGLPARATFFTQTTWDGVSSPTVFDPSNNDMVGWSMEITLDVEWAHAMAPGAHIVLMLAQSDADQDILTATQYAVDHNLGDVISQSFGENESCVDSTILSNEHTMFQNAASQNITVFASSGDEGAAQMTCDGSSWTQAVSSPASDPLVTAVGGTQLTAANYCLLAAGCKVKNPAAPGTYRGEKAWDEKDKTFGDGASGGGYSLLYTEPGYQTGIVNSKTNSLGVPDVAYNAGVSTGVLVYYDSQDSVQPYDYVWLFGGTSAGSPQWAAIAAIADQYYKANHPSTNDLGFINGALYNYATMKKPASKIFHDVKAGVNSVSEPNTLNQMVKVKGYPAHAGWDPVTGLGTPDAAQIVYWLAGLGPNYNMPAALAIRLNLSVSSGAGGVVTPH